MSPIVTNPNWFRSVEPLYEPTEFTGAPLQGVTEGTTTLAQYIAAGYTYWQPGHVADVTSGQVVKSTSGATSGRFYGLMFSEISTNLDECIGPNIRPVLLQGPGLVKVYSAAFKPSYTFAYADDANHNELVAETGYLIQRADSGQANAATVARLIEVDASGEYIVCELLHPSVTH
ncbi:MAG: hypothetical protein JRN22_01920 [Nitrososphaerota archaeon]|nr:hypothetical protein [Nitrososphaerota archaeon]